jgi:hypothetical protein
VADAPANYDGDQTILINPINVYEATFYRDSTDGIPRQVTGYTVVDGHVYGTVPQKLQQINDCFQNIYQIWQGLDLSWVGNAANAAQDVNDELTKVQRRLFGDPGANATDPSDDTPGLIGEMSSLAASAAVNYSNVEETNISIFNGLNNAIKWTPLPPEDDGTGSGGSGSNQDPDLSPYDYPVVTEKYS